MENKINPKDKAEIDALQSIYQLCFNIPKIELHAHIGGCVRPNTFLELADANGVSTENIDFYNVNIKTAFEIFSAVGRIITSLDILKRIVKEIIEDYSKSNTKYLELRTGPKSFGDNTKEDYINAVIEVFKECEELYPHIRTRLLLSINRSAPMESNLECFELAKQFIVEQKSKYVVGIEFSGDPRTNSFEDYVEEIFAPAKELGIKISVHVAEVKDHHDETAKIFEFAPDRLGHCCFMDNKQFEIIQNLGIPVEVCPSSNKATMQLSVMSQLESIKTLYSLGCTIIPCWDDTMLFNTNLIAETFEIVNLLKLSELDLKNLMIKAVDAIFDESVKEELRLDIMNLEVKGEEKKQSSDVDEESKE